MSTNASSQMRCVSLFAGIGGFDLGFERAGIETVALAEKDESCRRLLATKFPKAAIFDDVRTVGRHNLPDADVVLFGFPCQDLSVAGNRAGLAGGRSGLYYEATRIVNELRPAFAIWENVPGLLSSNDGRDFLAVLVELDRIGYHGAWRMLDAQYLGVAQRRRRVFGCFTRLDLGAASCAEVLSLAEGLRWHPAPRRKAREGVAGTLAARSQGGGGFGTDFDLDEGLQVAGTLDASRGGADENDAEHGRLIPEVSPPILSEGADAGTDGQQHVLIPEVARTLMASRGQRNNPLNQETWVVESREPLALNARQDPDSWPNVTGPLDTDGSSQCMCLPFDETQITHPENRSNPKDGDPSPTLSKSARPPTIAFSSKDHGADAGELSPTLRAGNHANGGCALAVTVPIGVRRLTPTECERLQGLPDGWTAGFSDSTRYKMLGNAVAATVSEWIGRRLAATAASITAACE